MFTANGMLPHPRRSKNDGILGKLVRKCLVAGNCRRVQGVVVLEESYVVKE